MPLSVKLAASLIALGFHPRAAAKAAGIELPSLPPLFDDGRYNAIPDVPVEFDHDPPLSIRQPASDLMPTANDPRFIVPLAKPAHARKTNGDPAAPLSGDKARIAKAKRLTKAEVKRRGREAYRQGLDLTCNPHLPQTPERPLWIEGWQEEATARRTLSPFVTDIGGRLYTEPLKPKRRIHSRPWPKGRKMVRRK